MTDEQTSQEPQVVETSLHEILDEANLAMGVMSKSNPHRRTLYRLGGALEALAQRYIQKCGECDELKRELEDRACPRHPEETYTEEATHEQPYVEVPSIVLTDR